MLAAAVIGIFVIPMLYVVFQWMRERTGWKPVLVKPAAPVESLQTQSPAE
jgi:HAE1 family hydrophobic/amphiphilic exporter-1